MTDWTTTYDAVFFLSGASILFGGLGVMLSFCFKSKCSQFTCCGPNGCIYILRDVDAENEETKMELDHIPTVKRPSLSMV